MRALIRAFDKFLRRRYGVFEFDAEPVAQFFRLELVRLRRPVSLPGLALPAGSEVLGLHIWNEHMPPIPAAGPDMASSLKIHRMFLASLDAVGRQMRSDPRLAGVRAVRAVGALFGAQDGSGGEKVMRHVGFEVYPYRSPLGRFGEFWENLYSWALMWTYNQVSLRQRRLFKLRRSESWMSADAFMRRFGVEKKQDADEHG